MKKTRALLEEIGSKNNLRESVQRMLDKLPKEAARQLEGRKESAGEKE